MISRRELQKWLRTLPNGASVGIDEGGLVLCEVGGDAYIEIGGLPEPMFECQNCGEEFAEDDLVTPIPDLDQRVAAGEPMPAGECPECGALCHAVEFVSKEEASDGQ